MRKVSLVFTLLISLFFLSIQSISAKPDSRIRLPIEQASMLTTLWYLNAYFPYLNQEKYRNSIEEHLRSIDRRLPGMAHNGEVSYDDLNDLLSGHNPGFSSDGLDQGLRSLLNQLFGNPFGSGSVGGLGGKWGSQNPFSGKSGQGGFASNDLKNGQLDDWGRQAGLGPVSGLGHWGSGLDLGKKNPFGGSGGFGSPGGIFGNDGNPVTGDTFRSWASQESGLASVGGGIFGGHWEERGTGSASMRESGWGHAGGHTYRVWVRDASDSGGAGGGGNGGSGGQGVGAGAREGSGGQTGTGQARVEMGEGVRQQNSGSEPAEERDNSVGGFAARMIVSRTANQTDAVRAFEVVLARNPSFSDSGATTAEQRHSEADRRVNLAEYELRVHPNDHSRHESREERADRINHENRETARREQAAGHWWIRNTDSPGPDGEVDPNRAPGVDGEEDPNRAPGVDGEQDPNRAFVNAGVKYQPAEDGGGPIDPAAASAIWQDQNSGRPDPNSGGFFQGLMNYLQTGSAQKQNAADKTSANK